MVAPGMQPCVIELYADMEFLNRAVSIGIDRVCPASYRQLTGSTAIICNADAAIHSAACNRRIGKRVISGVFYVVGLRDGKLCSLSNAEIREYIDMFREPEEFSLDDSIDAFLDAL